jgi:DNA-binding CsgD family transcriptional regulator
MGDRALGGDALLRLVDRIYEGAVDARVWPGLIRDLTDVCRSPKGLLLTNFVAPEHGGLNISTGISQSSLEQWNAHYIPHDVWTQAAIAKGKFQEGVVLLGTDIVPEHEFVRSVIYRELLEREGVARVCAGFVFTSQEAGMHPTSFGVYRGLSDPQFGDSEREVMTRIIPHLSRSLGVLYRLRDSELKLVATLAALDRVDAGVLLLAAGGSVRHANSAARKLLERNDGLALTRTDGTASFGLSVADAVAGTAIARALAMVLDRERLDVPHFSNAVQVPRPSGRRPFVLQFAPLPARNEFSREAGTVSALVFITDPDKPIPLDAAMLKRLFGVTPAEAALAELLCAGHTLATAAAHLEISRVTAKTHLAALFHKTGTRRQAALVRMLISLGSNAT